MACFWFRVSTSSSGFFRRSFLDALIGVVDSGFARGGRRIIGRFLGLSQEKGVGSGQFGIDGVKIVVFVSLVKYIFERVSDISMFKLGVVGSNC